MPKCFVLMPFAKEFEEAYEYGIKPAAEAAGFTCYRADKAAAPGAIVAKIIKGIFSSDVIVADLTASNPNVFYELGVAHTIDNKTIVICEKGRQPLPFNLRSYLIIFYSRTIGGIENQLRSDLEQAFADFSNWRREPTNPVQDFRPIPYAVPLQEQARLEKQIDELTAKIRDLQAEKERDKVRVTILSLPEVEFQHLRNLAATRPFAYVKRDSFVADLRKLRSLGLINTKPGATIGGLPATGNLKEHLELTDTAREVLGELFRRFADGKGQT
jgi:hypothetical protein